MIRYIFSIVSAVVIVGLLVLILTLPNAQHDLSSNSESVTSPKNSFLIQNARVFTGSEFIQNQDIRVINGLIETIGSDLSPSTNEVTINASGYTVLPGLIDAHTHTYGDALKDALRFGVSAHLDMFTSENDLLATQQKRKLLKQTQQTDLFSSGTMATVERGHGTQYGFPIDTISSIEEVGAWITARKTAGVDYIKLVYMPYQNAMPSLDLSTATAVIKEAHAQGLKVYAHISKQAAAKDMINAGINGLVHIFADSLASEEIVTLALDKKIVIIPTLAVIASVDSSGLNKTLASNPNVSDYLSPQQRGTLNAEFGSHVHGYSLDIAKQNVKRFFDAGVPILAGSDAPNSGTAYGVSTHHEMFLLVDAGLSPQQALEAATHLPAKHFALKGRGQIKANFRADLLLIKGNPEQDIRSTLNIANIYKNGYQISRELNITPSKVVNSGTLGDFNSSDLPTIDGFMWAPSDDSMANGNSTAGIEHIVLNDSNGVLQVTTEVNNRFAFPWAGAAVGDFTPPIEGIDVSAFTQVSFKVKGTPGSYRLMLFSPAAAGIPPTKTFTVTQQWQTITLTLEDFSGFDQTALSGLAFVAGPSAGSYTFSLDDVVLE